MNRTDRLVALVMLLQSRRVITAAQMAEHFEVTERTIYRDMVALGEGGVPIVAEAGVGYSMMRGYHLPPVMFSPEEAFALVTAGMLAERMTDASVGDAMRSALRKVGAVLPAELQGRVERLRQGMIVRSRMPGKGPVPLNRIQAAMAERRVVTLDYLGAARDAPTQREVEPLGLVYYLDHWHLIAWCRLRSDVRDFRVDRILDCRPLHEPVPPRPDFDLGAYIARCTLPVPEFTALLEVPKRLMDTVRRHWGPAMLEELPAGDHVQFRLAYHQPQQDYVGRWLLSLGTAVRILEPASLRELVTAVAMEAAHHHREEK